MSANFFKNPAKPEVYTAHFFKKLLNEVQIPDAHIIEEKYLKREKSFFSGRFHRYPDYQILKKEGSSKHLLIEIESIGKNLEKDIEKYNNKINIKEGYREHLSGIL